MNTPRKTIQHSWLLGGSIIGLFVVLIIASTIGIVINSHVTDVAHEALQSDFQLEDQTEEVRAAVLDLRHYHRNILFAGPSRSGLADFDAAYEVLIQEINNLEEYEFVEPEVPQTDELRDLVDEYYEDFRPAIALYESDHRAFIEANDTGLIRINELDEAVTVLNRIGEQRAASALTNVESSSRLASFGMMVVIGGLLIFGFLLAYIAFRFTSELRELYAGQQVISEQLTDALRLKNEFIANASHELRTPLTVLRGNAEVAIELEQNCVHTPILEDILKESTRMSRLIEDLLFLARSDSGSLPLERARTDIQVMVLEMIESAEMLTRQNGSTLESYIDAEGEVDVDVRRIEQAVLILVDNAAKYGPAGGVVRLEVERQNDRLAIHVHDEGPGIPEEEIPRVFERLYRIDKARSRKRGGVGLGLAIAKNIVDAHNGWIETKSEVNKGTTMTIYLTILDSVDS